MISAAQMAASATLGAFIGYFTNAVAIKSLFRPLRPRWYSLGWQGVIPRNRSKLADNIARVVGHDLLGPDYLSAQLDRPVIQDNLQVYIGKRLERALGLSLAEVFARLPVSWQEEGLERWIRRALEGLTQWGEGDTGLELKNRLLDLLEQHLHDREMGSLLPPRQAEVLVARLGNLVSGEAVRERLSRVLVEQLDQYLTADTPLEEVVPAELRELLHDALRQQTPVMLQRLAVWLAAPDNVERLSRRILAALEVSAADESGLTGLIGGLGLQLFSEQLRGFIEERIPRVASEYLHSPEISRQVEEQLIASLNSFLRRPLGEVAGPYRQALVDRIGFIASAWIASPEVQERLGDFLLREYQEQANRHLGELLPQSFWPQLRARLLEVICLAEAPTGKWSTSLAVWVRQRVRKSRTPLRQWAGIEEESEAALSTYLRDQAAEVLRTEVPALVERLDIVQLVHARILGFELLKVEEVIKNIISDQLRYINLLGALLGGVVGLLLPFLNAYLRILGL